MTADGSMRPVPDAPDILVAGSPCVDFSKINTQAKTMWDNSNLKKLFEQYTEGGVNTPIQPWPWSTAHEKTIIDVFKILKDDDKAGVSTQTFAALLSYLYHRRPKILILENVANAPWKHIANFWLPFIGYKAVHSKADSKNFLIPQTRNRGYLMAVDHWHYGANAQAIVDLYMQFMDVSNWFKDQHRPLHEFLLGPEDPNILRARFDRERAAANITREVEARMCSFDHAQYRRENKIGDVHPYTRLNVRGHVVPKDKCWRAFIQSLGKRNLDLLDLVFAESAQRGIDLLYKTKTLDLGQGIYRMNKTIGVVGCILPDGDLYFTDFGRPILGLEALALQGMPLDALNVSVETQRELHNMAGNAMTATVVAAAMLSGFIAEKTIMGSDSALNRFDALSPDLEDPDQTLVSRLTALLRPNRDGGHHVFMAAMKSVPRFSTTIFVLRTLEEIMVIYRRGRRYCPCGGFRKNNPAKNLQKCRVCKEIRCKDCSGNPDHDFRDFTVNEEHLVYSVAQTEFELRSALPGRFQLAGDDVITPEYFDLDNIAAGLEYRGSKAKRIRPVMELLLTQVFSILNSHFYLVQVNVGQVITATYRCPNTRILLVIEEGRVTWRVFLCPGSPQAEALEKSHLSWKPEQPILQAVITDPKRGILPHPRDWELFWSLRGQDHLTLSVKATRRSSKMGPPINVMTLKVEVFDGRRTGDSRTATKLVPLIDGDYSLKDFCGAPLDELWACRDSRKFLYLDVGRTTAGTEDRWAITRCARQVDSDEYREITCYLPSD